MQWSIALSFNFFSVKKNHLWIVFSPALSTLIYFLHSCNLRQLLCKTWKCLAPRLYLWILILKFTQDKRPTGLKDHLSIRDSTLTSCQKGSYLHINGIIIEQININNGRGTPVPRDMKYSIWIDPSLIIITMYSVCLIYA